jgi:hypothetical protein
MDVIDKRLSIGEKTSAPRKINCHWFVTEKGMCEVVWSSDTRIEPHDLAEYRTRLDIAGAIWMCEDVISCLQAY